MEFDEPLRVLNSAHDDGAEGSAIDECGEVEGQCLAEVVVYQMLVNKRSIKRGTKT